MVTAGEDSGIVNLWARSKCGKQSPTQTIKGNAIGLLRVGNLIDLKVTLDTICRACKEKDSTYSEVINIVVWQGLNQDGGGEEYRNRGGVRPQLEAPGEADFGCMIEHCVASAKIGKVGVRHREALVTDIEVESRLNGVGEAGRKLPSKVPVVGGVSADFG